MGQVERFVGVSVKLTGFDEGELVATGMAGEYLRVVVERLGAERYGRLAQALEQREPAELGEPADRELLAAARAVTQLWYLGAWPLEPAAVVSARAYEQGLVWRTFDGRAPGTQGAGPGSWALPPQAVARGGAGR
ncbi:hypothetical protein P3T36_005678 [Kitasatospora sp. MAP12-15]|uniref:hypothetical protein n=1 Tax=unclassified Kitasatospora TaxID=2633591 RepID=UPI002474B144|nr:hypothetical protein [Kitasatospora sp. MAP12-44]MDH6113810.1 hypothetical protein [Kitasatospora sp. MAP12-44]